MYTPPRDDLRFSNTTGILLKKKTMWFIGVEVEQETSAPPPKKNPGSAPENGDGVGVGTYLSLSLSGREGGGSGWALIRGWVLIKFFCL